MRQVELRLPNEQWRELKQAIGCAEMNYFSSPDYDRPNFLMVCGQVEIIVIKAEDGPPQWKGVHAPYKLEELCTCKHLTSLHTKAFYRDGFIVQGGCLACDCEKFTPQNPVAFIEIEEVLTCWVCNGSGENEGMTPKCDGCAGTGKIVIERKKEQMVDISDRFNRMEITRHDLTRLIYERNELLEATVGMVQQHCEQRTKGIYKSGFLSANAFALRTLCEFGAMQLDYDGSGCGVTAKEISDFDAFKSSRDWRALVDPPLIEGEK